MTTQLLLLGASKALVLIIQLFKLRLKVFERFVDSRFLLSEHVANILNHGTHSVQLGLSIFAQIFQLLVLNIVRFLDQFIELGFLCGQVLI